MQSVLSLKRGFFSFLFIFFQLSSSETCRVFFNLAGWLAGAFRRTTWLAGCSAVSEVQTWKMNSVLHSIIQNLSRVTTICLPVCLGRLSSCIRGLRTMLIHHSNVRFRCGNTHCNYELFLYWRSKNTFSRKARNYLCKREVIFHHQCWDLPVFKYVAVVFSSSVDPRARTKALLKTSQQRASERGASFSLELACSRAQGLIAE